MTKEENQGRQNDKKKIQLSLDTKDSYGVASGDTELQSDMHLTLIKLQKENLELRKMHNDMERSLLNFNNLFDFAPTAYFTLDHKFCITEVNHAACKLFARKHEDLIDMSFIRLIAPEYQENFLRHLKDLGIHTGRNNCDLHINKPGGEKILLHLESVVTATPKGKTVYRHTATDISKSNVLPEPIAHSHDPQQALLDENTTQQQNVFLNSVLESLPHPFCVIDVKDYSIIKANVSSVEIFGKRDKAYCYTVMHGLKQPCDSSSHLCPMNLVRKTNQSARVEHTHFDKNGNARIMDVYCYPIFGEDGKLSQVIEYALDITERKTAEDALRVELEMSKALAEIAFDTLSSPMSMDQTIQAVHRNALSLTGCKQGFTGALFTDRSVKYALGNSSAALSESLRIEELPYGLSEVWLAACKFPLVEGEMSIPNTISGKPGRILSIPAIANGQVLGLIVLYADDRKFGPKIIEIMHRLANLYALSLMQMHTAQELNAAISRAEESDRLKSMFLSNMSHDIRTPMNAIVGFSEMLLDPGISREESIRFLDIIINSGDALLRLINDIIDISKIEARQLKMIKSNFSLNELFSDLYLSFSEEMSRNKLGDIRLVISKQYPEKDFTLFTDIIRLRQIFSNLLGNALKFTDRGNIEFGYTFSDPKVFRFFVRDSGIGIPQDKMDFIFERFGQIEETHDRNKGGTGLGLAISKSLVELLGGAIWVESEVGQGTCFYFTLPAVSSTRSSELPVEIPNVWDFDILDWSDKLILVAEDVDSNYFLIQTILKKTGANLQWAKNGQEAYEMCRKNYDIDLVLMDIQMPVMNGYDATREIKKIRPSLPVIAQTAYAMSGEKEKSIDSGCDDYIPKPLKKKELLLRINRFFSS